jgi:hypothetical protein
MKLLIRRNVFGWVMTGLRGKDAKWFLGFSRQPADKEIDAAKRNQN